jgi:hypothetical protein
MRGARVLFVILGAILGEIAREALPDIIKHTIYAHIVDFLTPIVNSGLASVIAYTVEHAIFISVAIGVLALAIWLAFLLREQVVESGIMSSGPSRHVPNIKPTWVAVALLITILGTVTIMQFIHGKNDANSTDIRLNIAPLFLSPPGEDPSKNPSFAVIGIAPAYNHSLVGVSHNAAIKFVSKLLHKEEEDAQMRIIAAPMPPPNPEGNELTPGQLGHFYAPDKSITSDEWRSMLNGDGAIYVFAIAKY